MGKNTVVINVEYFNALAARYRSNFSAVDSAITYAQKTQNIGCSRGMFNTYAVVIKNYHSGFDYDINCISSVFAAADEEMRKRAEELIGKDIIDRVSNGESIVVDYYDIKPDLKEPRELDHTQYGYTTDKDGNLVYDHPLETEQYLHRMQGEGSDEFKGTCSLCACVNILRLAGVEYSESEFVDYAQKNGLCSKGYSDPGDNGGAFPSQNVKLLEHYGVKAKCVDVSMSDDGRATDATMNEMASYVEQGRGVIISVVARDLNSDVYGAGNHAIVVTSVVRDSAGNIKGYYVCDSNAGKTNALTNYYTVDQIQNAMNGMDMVVTDSVIR